MICKWLRRFKKKPVRPVLPVTLREVCPPEVAVDYAHMLGNCKLRYKLSTEIKLAISVNLERFMRVQDVTFVPWQVVAFITLRETGFDWSTNDFNWKRGLHNGNPWNKKTVNVPSGLGPFRSWEEAAIDALNRRAKFGTWNTINTLWFLEKYNGLGYRKYHPDVKTPYLWSGTNQYYRGGYASDGDWSETYVNKQIGAVLFLKELNFIPKDLVPLNA